MTDSIIFQAHDNYVLGLEFSRDGKYLASVGMDKIANLWSTDSWELVRRFEGHANSVNSLAITPGQKRLVTGSSDNTVRIWSFTDGKLLHQFIGAGVKFNPL